MLLVTRLLFLFHQVKMSAVNLQADMADILAENPLLAYPAHLEQH